MLINQSVTQRTSDKVHYVNIHSSSAGISHQPIDIFEYSKSMLTSSDEALTPLPRIAKITYPARVGSKNSYIQGVIC